MKNELIISFMIILGIETSCDETAISVVKASENKIEVLSNIISSQIKLHAEWGGVVPNLAAREHLKNIIPVLEESLGKASVKKEDIDLIAVTQGPGLIPALLIGTTFAKTLSYLWEKPLLGIHHIEGHIYANFISNEICVNSKCKIQNAKLDFPLLALVVSGGHTQLVLMKDHLEYEIIGETQDDAVGEAFDKVARILGLGYPGGPAISQLAEKWKLQTPNNKNQTNSNNQFPKNKTNNYKLRVTSYELPELPRPMINKPDFDFSFSGLKTAVLYAVKNYRDTNNLKEDDALPENFVNHMSYEFQEAATDVLVKKTVRAAKKFNPRKIVIAGGVSANKRLDEKMKKAIEKNLPKTIYQKPNTLYSLDNASMIAAAAYHRWKIISKKQKNSSLNAWKNLETSASLNLK